MSSSARVLHNSYLPNPFCPSPEIQETLINRATEIFPRVADKMSKRMELVENDDEVFVPVYPAGTMQDFDELVLVSRALGEIRVGEGSEEAESLLAWVCAARAIGKLFPKRSESRFFVRTLLFSDKPSQEIGQRLEYYSVGLELEDDREQIDAIMFDFPFAEAVAKNLVRVKKGDE
jgi:hypothetical protein